MKKEQDLLDREGLLFAPTGVEGIQNKMFCCNECRPEDFVRIRTHPPATRWKSLGLIWAGYFEKTRR